MSETYHPLLKKIPSGTGYRKKAGEMVILADDSLQFIHILLDGICQIEKYNIQGHSILEKNIQPLQFFGLFEAINGTSRHTVSIRCTSDCTFRKIPAAQFVSCVRNDRELMWICLQYLAAFTHRTLSQNDRLLMNDIRRNILYKVYHHCEQQTFPVTVAVKKEDLARELNINLRTLYRHLDRLYKEELLTPIHGKITVSYAQYHQIFQELFPK